MSGPLTLRKWLAILSVYFFLFLLTMVLAPLAGSDPLDVPEAFRQALSGESDKTAAYVLFRQRVPRVMLALLGGGALALAGAAFQVILRNPLAEPYTLGVAGGAAVGAVAGLSITHLTISIGPFSSVQVLARGGAGLAGGLIYRLARRPHGISMSTLLLAGVTISILSGGIIMFIRYLADPYSLLTMDRWLMGGLQVVGYQEISALFPLLLPGLVILLMQAPALNHLSLGEAMASGHGVSVARVQRMTFLGGGLVTAAVVSLTGPIGFVGLIVPHAVRRLSGFDQRVVLPCSFLLGGAFLAACDTGSRALAASFDLIEIPVGVVTALIGGPIFIKILLGRRR